MRSAIVLLGNTSESELIGYLDSTYQGQRPWIDFADGNACLYINFYYDGPYEFDPNQWAALLHLLGNNLVAVSADISGRYGGVPQVWAFIFGLLTRYQGVVVDDYTTHLWTLAELQSDCQIEGHGFFHYIGMEIK